MTEHTKEATRNRAVLVGLNAHSLSREDNASETSLEELAALVETAGGTCVGSLLQNRDAPEARTFIGEGKVAEVTQLVQAQEADLVVFDNELSPSQQRVLTEEMGVQVIDRAGLILDIFAQRARTKEGRLQVELAQYKYLLPRLTGMWGHLVRQTANPPSVPAAPVKPSWRPTAATSAEKSPNSPRTSKRSGGSGQSSGTGGRRTRCLWWPLWATPTRASPPCSTT